MGYHAIEDYGIIGDMHTAALVSKTGSIDWLCFPHFDSPSIFAALLDDKKGGSFRIEPMDGDVTFKQMYWPNTNILITRFLSDDGVAGKFLFLRKIISRKGCHFLLPTLCVLSNLSVG